MKGIFKLTLININILPQFKKSGWPFILYLKAKSLRHKLIWSYHTYKLNQTL